MDWTELKLFKGIDLNDSFVLNWTSKNNFIVFDLEASIWPESSYYLKPKENEFTCYRKATLTFTDVTKFKGLLNKESVKPSTDLDGTKDYGEIESLSKTNSGFNIVGDFGNVIITGGMIEFTIHT
jgi:hypothetical protein